MHIYVCACLYVCACVCVTYEKAFYAMDDFIHRRTFTNIKSFSFYIKPSSVQLISDVES